MSSPSADYERLRALRDDEDSQRAPGVVFVGEGAMPAGFDRVNWAAYAFAPLWALVYGPRRWRWTMISPIVVAIVADNIALLFFDSKTVYPMVSSITGSLLGFVYPVLGAWYAVQVNRAVWADRAARLAAVPGDFGRALAVDRYLFWQRLWSVVYFVMLVIYAGLAIYLAFTDPKALADWPTWWGMAVLAGLFLYARRGTAMRGNKGAV